MRFFRGKKESKSIPFYISGYIFSTLSCKRCQWIIKGKTSEQPGNRRNAEGNRINAEGNRRNEEANR